MKRIVSVILAVSIMLANSVVLAKEYPQKFWDVSKDHWAFEAVSELNERGVINGYEDGSFQPNKAVSRAEWAKMMVDVAGITTTDNAVWFDDMTNHWANKYVNAAEKYMPGTNGGYYLPDQAASREDVTVSLVKICEYDISYDYYGYLTAFTDTYEISKNNRPYVNSAIKNNLISGFDDNTFRGQNSLTRAEAAVLLYRAFKNGNPDVEKQADKIPDLYICENIYIEENGSIISTNSDNDIYFITLPETTYGYDFDYESKLYQMDLNGNYKEIYDIKNIEYKSGDVTLSQFEVNGGMCYDKYTDSIILLGQFAFADYINYDLSPYVICAIQDGNLIFCGSLIPGPLEGSLNLVGSACGGLILETASGVTYYTSLDCKTIIEVDDPSTESKNHDYFHIVDVWDAVDSFYMLTEKGLYECIYSEGSIFAYNLWKGGSSSGYIADNMCVLPYYNNEIKYVDFSGKIIKMIPDRNTYQCDLGKAQEIFEYHKNRDSSEGHFGNYRYTYSNKNEVHVKNRNFAISMKPRY